MTGQHSARVWRADQGLMWVVESTQLEAQSLKVEVLGPMEVQESIHPEGPASLQSSPRLHYSPWLVAFAAGGAAPQQVGAPGHQSKSACCPGFGR